MNLFDPFVNRYRKRDESLKPSEPVRLSPQVLKKKPQSTRDIHALLNEQGTVPQERPRLASPAQDPAPAQTAASPMDRYKEVRAERERLANTKPVNNDKGFWGRIGDIFREAVVGAGRTYASTQGTPQERLMAAIGGGIAGGAYGGFHPQADEERQQLYQIAQMKEKEQELLKDAQLERVMERDRLETEGYGLRNQGARQELELNAPVDAVDPLTGQTVKTTGRDVLQRGTSVVNAEVAAKASVANKRAELDARAREKAEDREFQRERLNVEIQNQAGKFNAEKQFEAMKANANTVNDWVQKQTDRAVESAKMMADSNIAAGEAGAMIPVLSSQRERIVSLTQSLSQAVEPAEVNNLQSQLSRAYDEFNRTTEKYNKAITRSGAQKQLADQFKIPTQGRPTLVKAPVLNPKTLSPKKQVSRSKDPLGLFR